jgi:hypothetical protein
MQLDYRYAGILISVAVFLASCRTVEKASVHGLVSGYYKMRSDRTGTKYVYLDVTGDKIDVHSHDNGRPDLLPLLTIPLTVSDSLTGDAIVFRKQSLDIDLTSILFKYRPSVDQLPAQLNTDLNIALYAGWRHDSYHVSTKRDPLGRTYQKFTARGYDFGFFVGPGTTMISPFTTRNRQPKEYSGLIIQTGIAGFIESDIASFGLSVGFDYLLNQDRKIWAYRNRPWAGFIIGIALN